MPRAYARIGRLETELGNHVFARVSSTYLGNTLSLVGAGEETEWLGPRSEEFSFHVDGQRRALLDVGYVEWFDDLGPLGAVLTQRRTGNGLLVTIEDVALEHTAGLLRRMQITNLTQAGIHITQAAPLDWTLRGRSEVLPEAPGALVCRSAADRGLFLAGRGLTPEASPGALDTGRLVFPEPHDLEPGGTLRLPVLWIAPFAGNVAEAWFKVQGTMEEIARNWEAWHAERSRLERERE